MTTNFSTQTTCPGDPGTLKNTNMGSELNLTYGDGAFFSKHPSYSEPTTFPYSNSSFSLHRYGRWGFYDLTGPIDIYKNTSVFPIRIKASVGVLYAARDHFYNPNTVIT